MGNDEFGQDERAFTWKNETGDELRGQLENFDVIPNAMKAGAEQLVLHIRDVAGKLWAFYTNVDAERQFKKGFKSGLFAFGKPFAVKRMEDVPMKDGRQAMKHYTFLPRATAADAQARAAELFKGDEEGQPELPGVPPRKGAQQVKTRTVVSSADGFADDVPF